MRKADVCELSPPEAWQKLGSDQNAVLIDVRSQLEFDYVGHPVGAVNIPWKEAPAWEIDPQFVEKVRVRLRAMQKKPGPVENLAVLAICRSGARSMAAASALKASGFKNAINVAEGFEGRLDGKKQRGNLDGWRFHKLPWEQT